jgi:predicted PurR-regulated permease PerM
MNNGRFFQYRGGFLLVAGLVLFWLTHTFVSAVLIGGIFATVLFPLMPLLSKRFRMSESSAIGAALITFLFAVSFLIPIVVLILIGAEAALKTLQDLTVDKLMSILDLHGWAEKIGQLTPMSDGQIKALFDRTLQSTGGQVVNILQGVLTGLPGAVASTFVVLIAVFFFLVDGQKIVSFFRANSFLKAEETDRILHAMASLCRSVILASVAAGVIQSFLLALACLITGLGSPLTVGMATFIASFLPVIGSAPITIGLTIYAFATGSIFAGSVFLAFIVVVGLSDNIVRPYVLKGGGELHPLVGFVSAFGALDVLGFFGLFIGPVIAGFFFTILPMVAKSFPKKD